MGTLSKYFYEATRDKTCRDMLHPGCTCYEAGKIYIRQGVLGAMKHYLPGAATALLFRMNHWDDPEVWRSCVVQYVRCIVAGLPMTVGSFHFFCGFYNLLGRFSATFFVFLPSLLGACTCMFLPRSIVRAQGIGLFNMYIEFLIKRSRGRTMEMLRTSRLAGTLLFSAFSAAMMPALQYLQIDRFWFANVYKTSPSPQNPSKTHCTHHKGKSCLQHITLQIKRSFYFGLAIFLIKNIVPRLLLPFKQPTKFLRLMVSRFDYGLIGFFVGYKALYEICNCMLIRNNITTNPLVRASIAGFASGAAYCLYPNYMLFTYPITELIEVYWLVYMRSNLPKPGLARVVDRLPTALLAYAFSLGMMYHLRVVYPYYTNRYCHKLMDNGTSGRSETLARGYAEIMMGYRS
ncbi:uncharacterized protein LOC129761576 [Toxorhynchites rutilus septentrionalis]|uniref:uncharacterized protein LOC129761576 n=1 Tax=Toxorhynchites rutilus septentrionalis TaxID=329112 RepID=UPI00247A4204|nr:uncharacterized protein LOC129761576 [Toxorhynchites rutilus septentrionalis]